MKKLFISSDDFGMTYSVNEGIRLAYINGVLSSTNIMVPCPWFSHALSLAMQMDCDMGIHLTLTSEWRNYRWRPLLGRSSIADANGYCYQTIKELMSNAKCSDIRDECRMQIDTVLNKGLELDYVDLHMCIPSVSGVLENRDHEIELMEIVKEIAREYQLPYSYELDKRGGLKYFNSGLSISSKDYSQVENWLNNLTPGVHHLTCHCSVDSYEQSSLALPEDENFNWALTYRRVDMRLLLSGWFMKVIEKNRISIVKNLFKRNAINNVVTATK